MCSCVSRIWTALCVGTVVLAMASFLALVAWLVGIGVILLLDAIPRRRGGRPEARLRSAR